MSKHRVGDPTGDKCYTCGAGRIWIHDPTGRKLADGSPGWMRGCPNFGTDKCKRFGFRPKGIRPEAPKTHVDAEQVKALVESAVKTALTGLPGMVRTEVDKIDLSEPRRIIFESNGEQLAELDERPHSAMTEVMRRINAGLFNILLVGPAGTGKTTLAAQLAKGLGRPFASVSCSGGMPEWQLTGRSIPVIAGDLKEGEQRLIYIPAEFVILFESGGVFLADEFDACDPNVLVVLNSALANGYLDIPSRMDNPRAMRHGNFVFMAAANTFGHGADMQYQGRNPLDAATLDRFIGATIPVDYDRDLEQALVPNADITLRVWALRDKVQELSLRRIVGTRALINAAKLHSAGMTIKQAIKALMVGWTPDECRKVGDVWA